MREVFDSKLQILASDEIMLDALRFVFGKRIEKEKPIIGEKEDNILIGEKYRAYVQAKELLNQTILDIETYKDRKTDKQETNKHR